jgi:hypothetical protein
MLTAADIEAEYAQVMAGLSERQAWAMEIYAAARALVAADRGAPLAGTPDEQQVAREMLFEAEARWRNERLRALRAAGAA